MFWCFYVTNTISPSLEYPSWPQTTAASAVLQPLSHTVPHTLPRQISTRPALVIFAPTSLSCPGEQGATCVWYVESNWCQINTGDHRQAIDLVFHYAAHDRLLVAMIACWFIVPIYCNDIIGHCWQTGCVYIILLFTCQIWFFEVMEYQYLWLLQFINCHDIVLTHHADGGITNPMTVCWYSQNWNHPSSIACIITAVV